MQEKTKNNIITYGFVILLIFMFWINILAKDKEVSSAERRKLTTFPEVSIEKILNGTTFQQFEKYTTDQAVFRDYFRGIKTIWNFYAFRQNDNNDLFFKNNAIYKMEYPLNYNNVLNSFKKINDVNEKYLREMNVYYAIIPDKNYYLENDDHLKFDYNRVIDIAQEEIKNIKYIDIWNCLKLNDYYRTDLHWKQENLGKVVNKIEEQLNINKTEINNYEVQDRGEFHGTYYGQLQMSLLPDRIYTLTNNTIENVKVFNYEKQQFSKVYDIKDTIDKYDIYLSGATPLITIENPNSNTDKELLMFRDSFGSSLAPLLVQNYSKITLIDLRYISSNLLSEYIDFNNQDVLFIYSTLILNQNVLK